MMKPIVERREPLSYRGDGDHGARYAPNVKDLTAAGFTDAQAEALAYALRQAQQIDLSQLVTKADLATTASDLRREMAEIKSELIKWGVGMAIGIVGATVALLRLLPGGHP